jgi:hypothetical protein
LPCFRTFDLRRSVGATMANPNVPTAAEFTEFLRNDNPEEPVLHSRWFRGSHTWSRDELGHAAAAALANNSIRTLVVSVHDEMTEETANKISSIIRLFKKAAYFQVVRHETGSLRVPAAVVDAILRGMVGCTSPISSLYLTASGGKEALVDFMRHFSGITDVSFGRIDITTCILSEEFARAAASSLIQSRQQNQLEILTLHCQGSNRAVAQILQSAAIACTNLKYLIIGVNHVDGAEAVLEATRLVCVAQAAKDLTVKLWWHGEEKLDLSRFFGWSAPFWTTKIFFFGCRLPTAADLMESQALTNCTYFGAQGCDFDDPIQVTLESLKNLKELTLRVPVVDARNQTATGPIPRLASNKQVEDLAVFLTSRSMIDDVTLDLMSSPGNGSFSAITTLLQRCKGKLSLNLLALQSPNVDFAFRGLESCGLKAVSLRFSACGLVVRDHSRFLDIMGTNETVESFELDLVNTAGDWQIFAQSLAGLLRQNRSLQVLLLKAVPNEASEAILRSALLGLRENASLRELRVEPVGDPFVLPENLLQLLLDVLMGKDKFRHNCVFCTLGGGVSFPSGNAHSFAAKARFLLKQNRFGRRSALSDDPLDASLWPYLLGNVAADPEAQDVMHKFLKIKASVDRRREFEADGTG